MFYAISYLKFVLSILRSQKRVFGAFSAAYVADIFNRASMAGMTEIPEELIRHTAEEITRAAKNGVIPRLTLPGGQLDLILYIPAVSVKPLIKAGVITESEAAEVQEFSDNHAEERDVYKNAVKATVMLTKVRATIAALDSGVLKIY